MIDPSYYDLNTVNGLIVAFLLFVVGLFTVRMTHHKDDLSLQTKLFVVAFFARIVAILAVYEGGLLSIVQDADSSGWTMSLPIYVRWQSEGYSVLTAPVALVNDLSELDSKNLHVLHLFSYALLFLMTGLPGRISAAALNALFGSLIPVLGYRMSIQIFGDSKAARNIGWTLTLLPSLLVFSALTLKEPFVVFFEVFGLYCCVQIAQRRIRIRYVLGYALSIYAMFYLRFYIFYVLVGTLITAIVVPPFVRSPYRRTAIAIGILASPLVMYVGYRSATTENENIKQEQRRMSLNVSKSTLRSYSSQMGGASYVQNPFDISKPSQFLPGLLFGLVHILYAPFPWNLARGSILMLLTSPEVLWWYYAGTIPLYRGIRYGLRENLTDVLIVILFCLPLLYYYSLIFSNIGLSFRYRAQIYPELLLLAGFGYKRLGMSHGYQSYTLPETDDPDEFVPIDMPFGQQQPWIARGRFDDRTGNQTTLWQNRNDRFGQM